MLKEELLGIPSRSLAPFAITGATTPAIAPSSCFYVPIVNTTKYILGHIHSSGFTLWLNVIDPVSYCVVV